MSEEQVPAGIKETQEVAALVAEVVKGFNKARADGKWDATDIQHLLPVFVKLGPALEGFDKVGTEIKYLDAEEIKTLAVGLLADMALEDGKLKVYVEEGLNVVVSVYKIIKAK